MEHEREVTRLAWRLRSHQQVKVDGRIVGCECGWRGRPGQVVIPPVDLTLHQAAAALGGAR